MSNFSSGIGIPIDKIGSFGFFLSQTFTEPTSEEVATVLASLLSSTETIFPSCRIVGPIFWPEDVLKTLISPLSVPIKISFVDLSNFELVMPR